MTHEKCFVCGSTPSIFPDDVFCPNCDDKSYQDLWLWDNTQRNRRIGDEMEKLCRRAIADMQAEGIL